MLTQPSERPGASSPLQGESSGPDFRVFLRETRDEVDLRLTRLFDEKRPRAASLGADVLAMYDAAVSLTLRGGKRLRPALIVASHLACGGADSSAAIDAGVALELLQTYMLIHDDWMDRDDLRRGGPSVHALLVRHHGDVARGEASAILAGDYTSALAQEAMASMKIEPAIAIKAVSFFAKIQQDVVFGQQLDLSGRSEDVEIMHSLKTGAYTVRGPLLLGAILANASAEQVDTLERFGGPLGVAFQLRDDLLGTFGSSEETGKPSGSDLRAGKRTAVIAEAERRLQGASRDTVMQVLGNASASDDQVADAVRALVACGAKDAVEARLVELVDEALSYLNQGGLSAAGVSLLAGAARAISVRRS